MSDNKKALDDQKFRGPAKDQGLVQQPKPSQEARGSGRTPRGRQGGEKPDSRPVSNLPKHSETKLTLTGRKPPESGIKPNEKPLGKPTSHNNPIPRSVDAPIPRPTNVDP